MAEVAASRSRRGQAIWREGRRVRANIGSLKSQSRQRRHGSRSQIGLVLMPLPARCRFLSSNPLGAGRISMFRTREGAKGFTLSHAKIDFSTIPLLPAAILGTYFPCTCLPPFCFRRYTLRLGCERDTGWFGYMYNVGGGLDIAALVCWGLRHKDCSFSNRRDLQSSVQSRSRHRSLQ